MLMRTAAPRFVGHVTTNQVATTASASPRAQGLPWGTVGDMTGLAVASALAAYQVGLRRGGVSIAVLVVVSLVTWFVFRELQPRLPGLSRVGYRFVFAAPIAAFLTLTVCAAMRDYYSRLSMLLFVLTWTAWVAIARYSLRRLTPPMRVLCLGDKEIAQELERQRRFDVELLLSPQMQCQRADLVVVDPGAVEHGGWLQWLLNAEMSGVPLMSTHRAREALTGRVQTDVIPEDWARGAFGEGRRYLRWKRFFDVAAVLVASPLIVLLSAAAAAVVLLDSGRPLIFSQLRVGFNNRPFRVYKFRTMRRDAEGGGAAFATMADTRVTRLGHLLRKTRLDELPQFWNVLRGDMSVIGPRPEQLGFAQFFDRDIPLYSLRHRVRPGITGWAQVRQGYAAGREEASVKLSYDLYYVKNCSLFLDILIVFHTARILLSGEGAR